MEYRANRFMYYKVIPHLAKYLWWYPDRARLLQVEEDLYGQIQSYLFKGRCTSRPFRIEVHKDRSPCLHTVDKEGFNQQSSNEPVVLSGSGVIASAHTAKRLNNVSLVKPIPRDRGLR
jgi:hypothetical protein